MVWRRWQPAPLPLPLRQAAKQAVKLGPQMGIAIVEPRTLDYIPDGERYDIPDLIEDVKSRGGRVAAYHLTGFWLDIGEMSDYQTANQLAKT